MKQASKSDLKQASKSDLQNEYRAAKTALGIAKIERRVWDALRRTQAPGVTGITKELYLQETLGADPRDSIARSSLLKVSTKLTIDLWDQVDSKKISIQEASRLGNMRKRKDMRKRRVVRVVMPKPTMPMDPQLAAEMSDRVRAIKRTPVKGVAKYLVPGDPTQIRDCVEDLIMDCVKSLNTVTHKTLNEFRQKIETLTAISTQDQELPSPPPPPPMASAEIRDIVLSVNAVVYGAIGKNFPRNRDHLRISKVVRSFLASLDDDLQLLAQQLKRYQKSSEGFDLGALFQTEARIPQAFAELGFPEVDLNLLPDQKTVKQSYKRLSYASHPDRYQNDPGQENMTSRFKKLQDSYHLAMNCYK